MKEAIQSFSKVPVFGKVNYKDEKVGAYGIIKNKEGQYLIQYFKKYQNY
jgi:hypothetical protein